MLISRPVDESPPTRPRTKVLDVNLNGVLYTAKLALHQFAKQQRDQQDGTSFEPTLILGASLASYLDMPTYPLYGVSKFGLRGLLYSLRHTSRRINARVGMIAPWHVETPMLGVQADRLKGAGIPLARLEDVIAAAVQFDKRCGEKW